MLTTDEYSRLASEWEAYAKAHPTDARALVEWGNALRYSGKYDEAGEMYTRAFRTDSTNAAALTAIASRMLIYQEGDWRLAHDRLLRAAKSDPTYPGTYYSLWITSLRMGDASLAKDCMKRLVDLGDMPRPLLDFGANLLASAPAGAVIFTNGDNDTYPPNAVQELTGFRTDVSIVNLSLLNLPWYVRNARDAGLPIPLDDSAIDALKGTPEQTVSARVVKAIFEDLGKKGWPRPLFYAVTVPEQNKAAPSTHEIIGLLERIGPAREGAQVSKECCSYDLDGTQSLITSTFRLDSITDPLIDWQRESGIARLAMNYVAILSEVGASLLKRSPPGDGGPLLYRAIVIATFHHKTDEAKRILDEWRKLDPSATLLPDATRRIEEGR